MDRIGDQLFSGSALSPDKNRGLAGSHTGHETHDLFHFGTSVNNIGKGVALLKARLQLLILPDQVGSFNYFLENEEELFKIDGLREVVEGSFFHGGHCRLHRSISGHHQDREVRIEPSDLAKSLQSIKFRHLVIDHGDIKKVLLEF